eukprot:1187903-Prorocentrum_minimum.AAC.3
MATESSSSTVDVKGSTVDVKGSLCHSTTPPLGFPEFALAKQLSCHCERGLDQAPELTVGQPMAVCRQGIYVEYSMEYSKWRALNGVLVSTVG